MSPRAPDVRPRRHRVNMEVGARRILDGREGENLALIEQLKDLARQNDLLGGREVSSIAQIQRGMCEIVHGPVGRNVCVSGDRRETVLFLNDSRPERQGHAETNVREFL